MYSVLCKDDRRSHDVRYCFNVNEISTISSERIVLFAIAPFDVVFVLCKHIKRDN